MGRATDTGRTASSPDRALAVFTDPERWGAFVDGLERVERVDDSWPAVGASIVWRSTPSGRGEVTERVEAVGATRIATRVTDRTLDGVQTFSAEPAEHGSNLRLELEYELLERGILTPLTDAIFIRRAVRDSLRRTLRSLEAEVAIEPA